MYDSSDTVGMVELVVVFAREAPYERGVITVVVGIFGVLADGVELVVLATIREPT
jgi:hypothetical protein